MKVVRVEFRVELRWEREVVSVGVGTTEEGGEGRGEGGENCGEFAESNANVSGDRSGKSSPTADKTEKGRAGGVQGGEGVGEAG